ncbi:TetR/AcrR family transcriptional regulator [Undibacterium sp.]|jgi:AcrR family transcriptional regulator|uniref:TetR/AcrR family transcriptional regulator n=1 Tax=Undibacterium sp. TaxID=1914977 RepID=UPI002C24578D|nr:TetR/AcrR family transcriptional regulator [Undibacterium sp.]HTD04287.1 TetR/AcrR family transcriptional regulator [Undibacterium sp.]
MSENVSRVTQMSPWSKSRDREREREIKREAVLRTAAQIFNEKGFHATSLDEVAERLHITKPTLYYYVKNKEEILFECVRIGLEMMREAIAEVSASGGTAMAKLIAAMRKYAEIVTLDFGMCLIRVGEDPLPPESRRKLRKLKAEIDREFRSLIEQGIAEGALAPCDPKVAAFTLAGALSWIGRWYRPDGPLRPDEIADQCISVLMNGLIQRSQTRAAAQFKKDASSTTVAPPPLTDLPHGDRTEAPRRRK